MTDSEIASPQAAFAEANNIPFLLLSDLGSKGIREFGILNTLVQKDEIPFYGIPFPGIYLVDEQDIIQEKFFPRHLANSRNVP